MGLCENPWPILESGRLHASFGTGFSVHPRTWGPFRELVRRPTRHTRRDRCRGRRPRILACRSGSTIPARDEKESLHVEAAVRLALRHCSKALAEIGHRAVGTRQTPRARACPWPRRTRTWPALRCACAAPGPGERQTRRLGRHRSSPPLRRRGCYLNRCPPRGPWPRVDVPGRNARGLGGRPSRGVCSRHMHVRQRAVIPGRLVAHAQGVTVSLRMWEQGANYWCASTRGQGHQHHGASRCHFTSVLGREENCRLLRSRCEWRENHASLSHVKPKLLQFSSATSVQGYHAPSIQQNNRSTEHLIWTQCRWADSLPGASKTHCNPKLVCLY